MGRTAAAVPFGAYSEEKFTNWTPFDPFAAEARRASAGAKARCVARAWAQTGSFRSLVHLSSLVSSGPFPPRMFGRPFSEIPCEHLVSLDAVFLLGGTAKQLRSRRFHYGSTGAAESICTRSRIPSWSSAGMRPETERGPRVTPVSGLRSNRNRASGFLRFTWIACAPYYLYDVLLHELGHHVGTDYRAWSKPRV